MTIEVSARLPTAWRLRLIRGAAVAGGVAAALAVWGVATAEFGVDVHQPAFGADAQVGEMTVAPVVAAAAGGGLAGWLLLAVLERITRRAHRVWWPLTTFGLLMSFAGPLSAPGISADDRLVLSLMHLAVGATVIGVLWRTSTTGRRES